MTPRILWGLFLALLLLAFSSTAQASRPEPSWPPVAKGEDPQYAIFPKPVTHYSDHDLSPWEKIKQRAEKEPFNLIATLLFCCAVLHTFCAGFFRKWAHHLEAQHRTALPKRGRTAEQKGLEGAQDDVSFGATMLHFLGEVEAIFALWVIPLLLAAWWFYGGSNVTSFVALDSKFTEPMFVVIIMAISASRPVIQFAEACLKRVAAVGKGSPAAWWLTVLTIAPLLGSLITEPAAMTISALLLARKFYELRPSKTFAYATLGLLFVNISVGGVLTNFAAPPVLMVAGPDRWNFSSLHMFLNYGDRAVLGILANNILFYLIFRKQLAGLAPRAAMESESPRPLRWVDRHDPVPVGVTLVHLLFLAWTVLTNHYPPLFVGGFLFFLAFSEATSHHQNELNIRGPLLVGLFLAGLVIHGRLQAWWLEPVLSSGINDWGLHLGAAGLTAFNDNALITFLASQVPGLDGAAKFAIMSGAVAGGGLTVIANAPNPAGQALLKSHFGNNISPLGLFLAALVPTIIVILAFMATHS